MKFKIGLIAGFSLFLLAGTASADLLYSNGPINGGDGPGLGDAFTINYGYSVSDSFTVGAAGTVTGFDFGSWNFSGDVLTQVDWAIGSTTYGNDLGFGTATGLSVSTALQYTNGDGYDIYLNTISGLNVALGAGTYWLTLQNAVVPNGDPLFWDENDGPSTAFASAYGNLANAAGGQLPYCANGAANNICTGSESFDVFGTTSATPEPSTELFVGAGLLLTAGISRFRRRYSSAFEPPASSLGLPRGKAPS